MAKRVPIYGLMAEFEHAEELVDAARKTREAGFTCMDAYTPFPIHDLPEAIGFRKTRLPLIVFVGGLIGGLTGYLMQYHAAAVAYPINVGGRPLHSWPAFIPVTFEMAVLFAALSAVLGMLALNGLPQPYHPAFNVPRFALASRDRFFLVIEARDPKFDRQHTREFLLSLSPHEVSDVEH
jgi:hypothetical protein